MYEELPYKYKYMINKIVNCIIQYIMRNLKNNLLIETKLILINNYILDVFNTTEISRNSAINVKLNNKTNLSTFTEKNNISKSISPEYDNNVTFSKLSNIILDMGQKNIREKIIKNYNEHSKIKLSPYNNNQKYKIIKLKKLLKNEQEKSMIKELSYLKRLSFVQEKLNFYESNKVNNDKTKNNIDLDTKNISFKFDEEKNLKNKINNNTISMNKNLDYFTLINSYRNHKINLFYPKTSFFINFPIYNQLIQFYLMLVNINHLTFFHSIHYYPIFPLLKSFYIHKKIVQYFYSF